MTLRAKSCPAGATERRGHQLTLGLLQARAMCNAQVFGEVVTLHQPL